MSKTAQQQTGQLAEAEACEYLQQQGLRLLERNYHCRHGELDLIMTDGKSTVFIEVRYRSNTDYGSGAETVNRRKQQKLIATASYYLQNNRQLAQQPARFDVISMTQATNRFSIDWIQDAFQTS